MSTFDRTVEEGESGFGLRRKVPDAVALGRWINPPLGVLGALVLSGYLMIGHPSTPVTTAPATRSDTQLALSNEIISVTHSSVARDESTRSSMNDVLNAALGTVLASAWLMGGAWVGIRSARISTPLGEPADQTRNAQRPRFTASSDL